MTHNDPTDKHGHVLIALGLALEGMGIGEVQLVNALSKKLGFHHRTVRKALEQVYHSQRFVPKVDLRYLKNGRIEVNVIDLPSYIKDSAAEEELMLLKLFSNEVWFGKKVPFSRVTADGRELMRILARSRELVDVDYDNDMIGLSNAGADEAFELYGDLRRVRDLAIRDFRLGTSALREKTRTRAMPLPDEIDRAYYKCFHLATPPVTRFSTE